MRLLLKIIAAPFALTLTLLSALMMFLFGVGSFLLTLASILIAALGIGLFFTPTPHGGIVFLILAFLLSPYGLQAVAGSVLGVLDSGKSALCRFVING